MVKFLIGFWESLSRDKQNRDLGAAQQREEDREADDAERKRQDEIDSKPLSADAAYGGFRLSGDDDK